MLSHKVTQLRVAALTVINGKPVRMLRRYSFNSIASLEISLIETQCMKSHQVYTLSTQKAKSKTCVSSILPLSF